LAVNFSIPNLKIRIDLTSIWFWIVFCKVFLLVSFFSVLSKNSNWRNFSAELYLLHFELPAFQRIIHLFFLTESTWDFNVIVYDYEMCRNVLDLRDRLWGTFDQRYFFAVFNGILLYACLTWIFPDSFSYLTPV